MSPHSVRHSLTNIIWLSVQLGGNNIEAPQHGHDVADEVSFDELRKQCKVNVTGRAAACAGEDHGLDQDLEMVGGGRPGQASFELLKRRVRRGAVSAVSASRRTSWSSPMMPQHTFSPAGNDSPPSIIFSVGSWPAAARAARTRSASS